VGGGHTYFVEHVEHLAHGLPLLVLPFARHQNAFEPILGFELLALEPSAAATATATATSALLALRSPPSPRDEANNK
jgi:hypothetical protein